ncbi:MAG: hypothetical protein FWG93_01665 [Oscillospiraceae bacterium]|nr:hypothetical protein [Oscillospiraceae bacterium]
MSPVRNQLDAMIDCLPDTEQTLLLEIVKRFLPDDVATPEDLEDIRTANEEFARGEFVRAKDIDW